MATLRCVVVKGQLSPLHFNGVFSHREQISYNAMPVVGYGKVGYYVSSQSKINNQEKYVPGVLVNARSCLPRAKIFESGWAAMWLASA